MRLLITGGAGCLGAGIVDHRLAQGDTICVIDNFVTSARAALPAEVEVHEGSVTDAALLARVFGAFRPDTVIHAAASYKDPDNWQGDLAVNAGGTLNVLKVARESGVRRFVNLQTVLCYGRPASLPVRTDAPLAPFTSYGISKAAGELYVLASGLDAVSLRIGNVTGPRLSIGPVPAFYSRLKEGKPCFCSDTVRDFLDMEDFLALIDRVMLLGAARGVFNAGSGQGRSILEVYKAVASALGIEAPLPPVIPPGADDVAAIVLDSSETERAFGWRPAVSFEESIRRMVRWYDANGVRAIYAHVRAPEGFSA
ncbi:NAD-dependent epimerase/dehydratase family protein [Hyphomonas sp.]|jgi:nucleoside-diphosphate-sugar epimerase|uniref:NAD-dependent epimerase/dehydratase family protein n=1 Tax=Hyphomonas sp. TaxID=87 RepID=UPI00391DD7CE